MSTGKEERQLARERRILRGESGWLQKALFALGKASAAQEKLAELPGNGEREPLMVTIDGKAYDIDTVTEAVKDAVTERSESLRATTIGEHVLAR